VEGEAKQASLDVGWMARLVRAGGRVQFSHKAEGSAGRFAKNPRLQRSPDMSGIGKSACEPSYHFLNFVRKLKQPVGTGGSNHPGSCALESAEASRLGTNNVS
jgi:hypothetical protein